MARKIPWSLVCKAGVFAASALLLLPRWVFWFSAVAAAFFFTPRFQSIRYLPSFIVLLAVALLVPHAWWAVALVSLSFLLLLGVKEMFFVNRLPAYQCFSLALLFLSFLYFFGRSPAWGAAAGPVGSAVSHGTGGALLLAMLPAFFFFVLLKGAMALSGDGSSPKTVSDGVLSGVAALLVWQVTIAALFLPLDYLRQCAVLFLVSAGLMELIPARLAGSIPARRLLVASGLFFFVLALILGAAPWGYAG